MTQSDWVLGDAGWISDESDFLGNAEQRSKLERRSQRVPLADSVESWRRQEQTLPVPRATYTSTFTESVSPSQKILFNRLEGRESARQLSESVDEFLERLPPLSSSHVGDWIWITDPHVEGKGKAKEAGNGDVGDSPSFYERSNKLLQKFDEEKAKIETSMAGSAKGSITRKITPLRKDLTNKLLKIAREERCLSGKWMLFPSEDSVPGTWRTVAEGVVTSRLGNTAKIATEISDDRRLICVYTKDFSDMPDVQRVLEELVALGLCPRQGNGIYYKCDAFTCLNILSANAYGLKASL